MAADIRDGRFVHRLLQNLRPDGLILDMQRRQDALPRVQNESFGVGEGPQADAVQIGCAPCLESGCAWVLLCYPLNKHAS